MVQATQPKGSILLVEDDLTDQMIFESCFKSLQLPYTLVIKNNGEEGFEYLKNTKTLPSIIISDINMPRMNGLEFAQEILKDATLPKLGIPFIFLTSSAADNDIEQAFALKAQGYFEKSNSQLRTKADLRSIIDYWERSFLRRQPKDSPRPVITFSS